MMNDFEIYLEMLRDPSAPQGPDLCLYSLAMSLRGSADGSAEGTLQRGEPVLIRDYLRRRLDLWGESRSASEEHFRAFLECCLAEAIQNAPWLFEVPR